MIIPAYLDIGFAHSLMRMDIFSAVPLFVNVFPEFLGHMMTVLGQTVYDVSLDQKVHSVYPQSNAFSICVEMMYIYIQYKGGARLIVQLYETPTNALICMRRETVEVQCKFNKEICAMRKALFVNKQR